MIRQEKEQLYIKKVSELQTIWGNTLPKEWDLSGWSDKGLEEEIKSTTSLIRFEKRQIWIPKIISVIVFIFVSLGVLGLLLFGIRQIF